VEQPVVGIRIRNHRLPAGSGIGLRHDPQGPGAFTLVDLGQTRALVGTHAKSGVQHAERGEDPGLHEGPERLAGHLLDDHPQQIGVDAVDEALAGPARQWQRRHLGHQFIAIARAEQRRRAVDLVDGARPQPVAES
jgi:hypothetical protein